MTQLPSFLFVQYLLWLISKIGCLRNIINTSSFLSLLRPKLCRSIDPSIMLLDLEPGAQPPWGPVYALSEVELQALREYLDEMLRTGKIRPSKSPAGAPILFVPKAHGRGPSTLCGLSRS